MIIKMQLKSVMLIISVQICSELLDPLEWFLMNHFNFVEVEVVK